MKAFLVALIGSVAVNAAVVSILGPVVNNPTMPLMALTLMPVVMFTVIGTIGATIVYAIMRAMMADPKKAFIWVSAVVLIVSFIPDYLIIGKTSGPFAGGTLPEALVLMLLHVVAAVIIVWALVKLWGSKAPKAVSMPAMPTAAAAPVPPTTPGA